MGEMEEQKIQDSKQPVMNITIILSCVNTCASLDCTMHLDVIVIDVFVYGGNVSHQLATVGSNSIDAF